VYKRHLTHMTLLNLVRLINILNGLFLIEFGKVMASLADKFGSLAAPVFARVPKEGDIENTPKVSNIKDVVQEMKTKSHIVVLTGQNFQNKKIMKISCRCWTICCK